MLFVLLCSLHWAVVIGRQSVDDETTHIADQSSTSFIHLYASACTSSDLKQSVRTSQFTRLVGRTQAEVAAKINKYMVSHRSVASVIPCSELNSDHVSLLASKLKPLVEETVRVSFPEDDGRQVFLDPSKVATHPVDAAYRDVQCVETVKLWAHHIPNALKDASAKLVLPSMPVYSETDLIQEHITTNKSVSCVAGHNVLQLEPLEEENPFVLDWPYWPQVVHFRSKGHGPYPFWQFGPRFPWNDGWVINESFDTGSMYNGGKDMEVWHSTPLKATKFYHSSCDWDLVGHKELGVTPCIAMQLGAYGPQGSWHLFTADPTTKDADESFCCDATFYHDNGMHLGTINRKFVDSMKYVGEVDMSGDYYTGRAKRYVMAIDFNWTLNCPECESEPKLPLAVWYETDLDGKPLRFAEIGRDPRPVIGTLTDEDFPLLYEEMDPESFVNPAMQVFSNSVFELPKVCETKPAGCLPGRQNRMNLMHKD